MRVNMLSLLVACSLIWIGQCRRSFGFNFKSTECSANPKYIDILTCSLDKVNSSSSTISMDLHLVKYVAKLTYDILIVLPTASQQIVLLNSTQLDGCKFLENESSLRLVAIIRKEFQKYSNIPNKCPVPKGTKIQVHELKLDPEVFPNYVPETKFYVRVRMYENGERLFHLTINGTCEHTRSFFSGRG